MNPKVLMHDAFRWHCPNCGSENFNRGLANEVLETMFEMELICAPPIVVCKKCKEKFESIYNLGLPY